MLDKEYMQMKGEGKRQGKRKETRKKKEEGIC